MTLDDLKNNFLVEYKVKARNRGLKEVQFPKAYIFKLINSALQHVQRELLPVRASENISIVSGTHTYSLSTAFGNEISAIFTDSSDNSVTPLDKDNIDTLESWTVDTETEGKPTHFAVYFDGNTAKIRLYPTPTTAGTLAVKNYKKLLQYAPSGDPIDFSTSIPLPDEYTDLIILYMLYAVLEDEKIKRDLEELQKSLKGSRVNSINDQLHYNFANLE